MLSQTLGLAFLASTALAMPQVGISGVPSFGEPFGITATGGPIKNVDLRANKGRLMIGGPQDTKCENNQLQQLATFVYQSDKTVFLYTHSHPVQQVWTDSSWMGQGITGYTTQRDGKTTNSPKNASFDQYKINEATGEFTLEGAKSKACPTVKEGVWSVWLTNTEKPGWQSDCFDVTLTAYKAPARVACEYSQYEN